MMESPLHFRVLIHDECIAPTKIQEQNLEEKEEKCYEKFFVLNANLHSLNSELTENHPERVVEHNSNLTECSYEKKAMSGWKISKTGEKKTIPTICFLTSKTANFYEVVNIEDV